MIKTFEKKALVEAMESVFGSEFASRIAIVPTSCVSKEFCFALLPQKTPSSSFLSAEAEPAAPIAEENEEHQSPRQTMVLLQRSEQFYGTRGFVDQYCAHLLDENGPVGTAQKETLEELLHHLAPTLLSLLK